MKELHLTAFNDRNCRVPSFLKKTHNKIHNKICNVAMQRKERGKVVMEVIFHILQASVLPVREC
jgi:hypothetical protein